MLKILQDKRALVTGGGTGIGKAIAQSLLQAGAEVTIACPEMEVLEKAANDFRAQFDQAIVRCIQCDITSSEQVERAVELAADGKGLDIAVANAGGIGKTAGPFLYLDEDAWRSICELNIVGTANTLRAAAWKMRDSGGSIVAISSAAAAAPEVSNSHFSATKAAVNVMVQNAAWELGHFGIRVNAIMPGVTMSEAALRAYSPDMQKELADRTALKRVGRPEEHGELVVYLASEAGSYITGQIIGVDGGMTVQPMADLSAITRRMRGDEIHDDAFGVGQKGA